MAAGGALLLLTLATFWGVTGNGFLNYDDELYLTRNPEVTPGLTPAAFLRGLTTFRGGNWHPLTWWSHQLDVSLFGLDPAGHHLVGLLLHAAAALLLGTAFHVLTGGRRASWMVAALFAVHPLRVESVAWAAERKDLVCGLFWAAALLAYGRYVRRPGAGRWWAVFLLCAAALMGKATAVTLPVVLLVLDWWPLGRLPPPGGGGWRRAGALVAEKLPLLFLSLAAAATAVAAQRGSSALTGLEALPWDRRLWNAALSALRYPLKLLWPVDLAPFYPYPAATPLLPSAGALALLLLALGAAWRGRRRYPFAAAGLTWYLVTLLPVAGLVQVGSQAMADRYTHLPGTGLLLAGVWAAGAAWRRKARALVPPAAAGLVALALITRCYAGFWRDSVTLFGRALSVTRDNWVAAANLAQALGGEGRLLEAAEHYRRAASGRPWIPQLRHNLGVALARLGRTEEAREEFRAALALDPEMADSRGNLAYLESGVPPVEVLRFYRRSLRLRAEEPGIHNRLGESYRRAGWPEDAARAYRRSLELDPSQGEVRRLLEELGGGG
jgi:tetratricopeptide (TPR) repeat protein